MIKRKLIIRFAVIVVMVFAFVTCVFVYYSPWFAGFHIRRALPKGRHAYLLEIDHVQLLADCRNEIARRDQYPKTNILDEEVPGCVFPIYRDPRLLPSVLALSAEPVVITPKELRADLYNCAGACAHYGFIAFVDGFEPLSNDDLINSEYFTHPSKKTMHDGAVEIIPGLWYYDTRLIGEPRLCNSLRRYYAAKYKKEVAE